MAFERLHAAASGDLQILMVWSLRPDASQRPSGETVYRPVIESLWPSSVCVHAFQLASIAGVSNNPGWDLFLEPHVGLYFFGGVKRMAEE